MTRLLEKYGGAGETPGEDRSIERFFFLGSGKLYGNCQRGHVEDEGDVRFPTAKPSMSWKFRHGPMSMVNEHSLVVGLISDEAAPQEIRRTAAMRGRGAQILALSEPITAWGEWAHAVVIDSGLPAWAARRDLSASFCS